MDSYSVLTSSNSERITRSDQCPDVTFKLNKKMRDSVMTYLELGEFTETLSISVSRNQAIL